MNRIWIGTLVAAFVAVSATFAIATREPTRRVVPAEPVSVRTSFEHSVVGFGDRVHARAIVLLDRRKVDASKTRVIVSVAPLAQIGAVRLTRAARGPLLTRTYDIDAICIYDECIGRRGRKLLELPAVRVEVPGQLVRSVAWPALDIRGRVVAADLKPTQPPLKRDVLPPPVDYRIAPATLAALLEILAAVLAVAGVAFAGRQLATIRRERRAWAEPLTEIERALELAREAESRPPADRRRALALLERLLRPRDARLAREARDLAWSSPPPEPKELDELVTQVERKVKR